MTAINISICHDDDFVIADFFDIHIVITNPGTDRGDQRANFGRRQHFIKAGPFNIQDFTPQRQNGLVRPVAALFGRPTSRITLDKKHLRFGRVTLLTIG